MKRQVRKLMSACYESRDKKSLEHCLSRITMGASTQIQWYLSVLSFCVFSICDSQSIIYSDLSYYIYSSSSKWCKILSNLV